MASQQHIEGNVLLLMCLDRRMYIYERYTRVLSSIRGASYVSFLDTAIDHQLNQLHRAFWDYAETERM